MVDYQAPSVFHIEHMRKRLMDDVRSLRRDIQFVTEPELQYIFESTADALNDIIKSFDDYETRTQTAWRTDVERQAPPAAEVWRDSDR